MVHNLPYKVCFDNDAINLFQGEDAVWSLSWADIDAIGYRTSASGPWFDDHFIVFRTKGDANIYDVSLEWDGAIELSKHVEALPDTRLTEKGTLVNCATEDSVVVWPSSLAGQQILAHGVGPNAVNLRRK